jgi:hypothetical protein
MTYVTTGGTMCTSVVTYVTTGVTEGTGDVMYVSSDVTQRPEPVSYITPSVPECMGEVKAGMARLQKVFPKCKIVVGLQSSPSSVLEQKWREA